MKVLFDEQIFTSQRFGGISRYFVELMRYMPSDIKIKLPVAFSQNAYIGDVRNIHGLPKFPMRHEFIKRTNRLFTKVALFKGDFDIYHPTYYRCKYLKQLKNKPYVVTVHDMIHERFSDMFPCRTAELKRTMLQNASAIIAISHSTKRDLIDILGIDESRITVIHHGPGSYADTSIPVKDIPENYILFVGDRSRYKNFGNMLKAFKIISEQKPNQHLVCTGRDFEPEELQLIQELGLENKVIQRSVNDGQLRWLYENAQCFVFPSMYEGFGFPILEAFAYKCPIAMSNTSSFPEIGGDGGLYFDPTSPQDIADKVNSLLDDEQLRAKVVADGTRQLGRFSWEKCAAQTAEVYRRIAQSSKNKMQ